jgi:peptidoglycan-associated lipoprotein
MMPREVFIFQGESESYTTQAPHNQIYLFDYDSSNLASKYMPSIHAQAEYLKGHPGAKVLLAGHTDERGSREYNIALGEHRAKKVAHILRMAGVASSQIRVVSYGKERPAYTGNNQESYRQNRRVEFTYEATR